MITKKYRIRKGSLAAKVIALDNRLNDSAWGLVAMGVLGLIIGGIFAYGMNLVHPLFQP